MGSNNILQFNATLTNIANDGTYSASSYRTGGCVAGIAPSNIHNKLFLQLSTVCTALAQAMANAGYVVVDTSLSGMISDILAFLAPGIRTTANASDTILDTDRGGFVIYTNAGAVAVSLPQANSTQYDGFSNHYATEIINNATGNLTITPVTSTIDGGATIVIPPGQSARIRSNNTNYFTSRGYPGAAIFTKYYDSGDQTITSNSSTTLAHGLGVVPKLTKILLHNISTELGYTTGDYADFGFQDSNNTNFTGIGLEINNGNILASIAQNGVMVLNRATNAYGVITNANWRFVIRAWY